MRRRSFLLVCAFLSLSFWVAAQDCREALLPGAALYKQARYQEAAASFRSVTAIHSSCVNAWLYLGTTYAQQYVPGADLPENNNLAELAIQAYEKVLQLDPKNIGSMKGIAYLQLQMKKFEESKTSYQRAADEDPSDPETPYSIGVIDWTMTYQPRMEERAKLGLNPTEPLKDIATCNQLRSKNSWLIDDGIVQLRRALSLRPDYDDAMAYMNLMYREKADLECDSKRLREKYLAIADNWVDRTMEVKRRKAEKQQVCEEDREKPSPCFSASDYKD